MADDPAADVVRLLGHLGCTVATAESLTGGLVCGALTTVPGSSAVVRGGVVSYATEVKRDVLGVDAELLQRVGAVAAETAVAMAQGARRVLGADWGVATTGVAGPEPTEGKPVGTVYVAACGRHPAGEEARHLRALHLCGTREHIRQDTVHCALALLRTALAGRPTPDG